MSVLRTADELRELHRQHTAEQIEIYESSLGLRAFMLGKSVFVEGQTSILLRNLIGIESNRKSLPFGNGGKALSFNTKLELLIDVGALSDEDRKVFELFGAIRNQFAHNWKANTMLECIDFIEERHLKPWKKRCPKWAERREADYIEALEVLCNDVVTQTLAITALVEERLRKPVEDEIVRVMRDALVSEVSRVVNMTREEIRLRHYQSNHLTNAEVLDLPIRIAQQICANVNKICEEHIRLKGEAGGLVVERKEPLLKFDIMAERAEPR